MSAKGRPFTYSGMPLGIYKSSEGWTVCDTRLAVVLQPPGHQGPESPCSTSSPVTAQGRALRSACRKWSEHGAALSVLLPPLTCWPAAAEAGHACSVLSFLGLFFFTLGLWLPG